MSHRRRGVVLAALLAMLAAAGTARADVTSPPSLAGEALVAGPNSEAGDGTFSADVRCNADESGSFTFSASGFASGPYAGTFTETGSVTVSRATATGPGGVLSFHADYAIVDALGVTTVRGSKDLVADVTNVGSCSADSFGYDAVVATQSSYTATIAAGSTSYRDTGSSTTTAEAADTTGLLSLASIREGSFSTFTETFDSSNGVTVAGSGGKVTGGGWIQAPSGDDKATFGFEAQTLPKGLHATCTFVDHTAKTLVRCLGADTLVVDGTHATFTGKADVGGVVTTYRIDVDDLGEPGRHDTFSIVTGNGYFASGVLLGGNIQIHAS